MHNVVKKIQKKFLPHQLMKVVEFCKFVNVSLKDATNCMILCL